MYVLREFKGVDEKGRRMYGDFLSMPFPATKGYQAPEGQEAVWAENHLFRAATALVVVRLYHNELFDPKDRQQIAILARAVKTVHGLGEAQMSGVYQTILGTLKHGEVNMRWSFKLNKAHWPFALRIARYYTKAVSDGAMRFEDSVLTQEAIDELLGR